MIPAKLTKELADALAKAAHEKWIDLVIELGYEKPEVGAGMDRAARIAAKKQAFAQAAEPITAEIERLGGQVLGQVWLSGAIRARVSPEMVDALTEQPEVAKLDQPRVIEADTA